MKKSDERRDILGNDNLRKTGNADLGFLDNNCDKKALSRFRNALSRLDFNQTDIYRLSLEFINKLSPEELKAKFNKILLSIPHINSPKENHSLAIEILLANITASEASKKVLLKKSEKEMCEKLKYYTWARPHLDKIVKKYAGEKSPDEVIKKFNLILADIPYNKNQSENLDIAASILVDRSNYRKVEEKIKRLSFKKDLKRMFAGLSDDLADKIDNKFSDIMTVGKLFEKCQKILSDLNCPWEKEDSIFALKILAGEISKNDALKEITKIRTKQTIMQFGREFELSKDDENTLLNEYLSESSSVRFDEVFTKIFSSLSCYPKGNKKNSFLTLQVLLGKIDVNKASDISRVDKNIYLINEFKKRFEMSEKDVFELNSIYTGEGSNKFLEKDIHNITSNFKTPKVLQDSAILVGLKVLLKYISRKKAAFLLDFILAFDKFAISQKDLDKITDKYLSKKNPWELAEIFQNIIENIEYKLSKEENYGLAVEILLDGSSTALETALKKTELEKRRDKFKNDISQIKQFKDFTEEITDKFFQRKTPKKLESDFNKIWKILSAGSNFELMEDIALKLLLGKISPSEAKTKTAVRAKLYQVEWSSLYARKIEESYLGIKDIDLIIENFTPKFEEFSFWKTDAALHSYIIEKVISELNGEITPKTTLLAMSMSDKNIPLKNTNRICRFIERESVDFFDPTVITEHYIHLYSVSKNHDETTQTILNTLKDKK